MNSEHWLQGPELAALTSIVSRPGLASKTITHFTELPLEETESVLAALSQRELIRKSSKNTWESTLKGVGMFYQTVGQIQDAIAPGTPAPTLPFSLTTTWKECFCVNYLVDAEVLKGLLTSAIEPVLFNGKGLISVAAASLYSMRPLGLPELVGQNFCHITYRAVVQFKNSAGEIRVGYKFLACVTNDTIMSKVGNNVTELKFHDFETGAIHFLRHDAKMVFGVESDDRKKHVVASWDCRLGKKEPPEYSIFSSREALDEQVLDFEDSFGHIPGNDFVYVLSIERDPWRYRFVEPEQMYFSYFQETPFTEKTAQLDSVLYCQNIRYFWRPLIKEKLYHPPS